MNENYVSPLQALVLAYGKGSEKKWALEHVILNALYYTKQDSACYLKFKDISIAGNSAESENDKEYILKFGYLFRLPRTEIDLHVNRVTGALYLTKEGMGYGYDDVEEKVIEFILQQKKLGNLYYQSNFNNNEYKL